MLAIALKTAAEAMLENESPIGLIYFTGNRNLIVPRTVSDGPNPSSK